MARIWMVRAGESGRLFAEFERAKCVAIGWDEIGDLSAVNSQADVRQLHDNSYQDCHPSAAANAAAIIWKFKSEMQPGDSVVTYYPSKREYLVGKIIGDYRYDTKLLPEYHHVRPVEWSGKISRDALSATTKNSLGSALSVFELGAEVLPQLEQALAGASSVAPSPDADAEALSVREDQVARAHEFVKDRILKLSPDDMEQLVAALLRAMGYKARVTPTGPDRGRDVIASPDGLGLQQPRIIAEVKHRPRESIGSQQVRSFLGALRASDCGIYVSTGSFTKDAGYEAERASVPITLVDLDELASLVVDNYERFDTEGRALLPLIRVYWPAS